MTDAPRVIQRAWGHGVEGRDGKGARRGTLVYGHESVSPPNDPKAEGIRLEREHRSCKVLLWGSAPVGKGDETGRLSGLLVAVLVKTN